MDSSFSESELDSISTSASDPLFEILTPVMSLEQVDRFSASLREISGQTLGPGFEKYVLSKFGKALIHLYSLDNSSITKFHNMTVPGTFQMDMFGAQVWDFKLKLSDMNGISYHQVKRLQAHDLRRKSIICGEVTLNPEKLDEKLSQLKTNMHTIRRLFQREATLDRVKVGMIVVNGDLSNFQRASNSTRLWEKNKDLLEIFDEFYIIHMNYISTSSFAPIENLVKEANKPTEIEESKEIAKNELERLEKVQSELQEEEEKQKILAERKAQQAERSYAAKLKQLKEDHKSELTKIEEEYDQNKRGIEKQKVDVRQTIKAHQKILGIKGIPAENLRQTSEQGRINEMQQRGQVSIASRAQVSTVPTGQQPRGQVSTVSRGQVQITQNIQVQPNLQQDMRNHLLHTPLNEFPGIKSSNQQPFPWGFNRQ